MKLSAYQRDGWYKIVAENNFGERSEYGCLPGDGIYEYLDKYHRLNATYVEYWLVRNNREEDQPFLEFLQRANDHRTPRRVRLPGWEQTAGLHDPNAIPVERKKGPGDVVVYGDCARMGGDAYSRNVGVVDQPIPKKKKRFGVI